MSKRYQKAVIKDDTKENRRQLAFILTMVLIAFIAVVGSSYAVFTLVIGSNTNDVVRSGTFSTTFTDGQTISLTNAAPVSDEVGMSYEPYTFTIKNTGSINAIYRIVLKEDPSVGPNIIDKRYIRFSYKEGNNVYTTPDLLSRLKYPNVLVSDKTLNAGASITYELKLWLDATTPNAMQGKTYKAKVVVESVQAVAGDFKDTTPPYIILNGEFDLIVYQNGSITLPNPQVNEVRDDSGYLDTNLVKVSYEYYDGTTTKAVSSIDTSKLGVYYIYYKISDNSGNEGVAVRTVSVHKVQNNNPKITLVGSANMSIDEGTTYTEPGVNCTDKNGTNLSNRLVTIGKVNTNRPGVYVIKYIVSDDYGNFVTTTRTVTVNKKKVLLIDQLFANSSNTLTTANADIDRTQLVPFSQPATANTPELTDYRYIGSDPYNFIWFNDEYWRIVGIFDEFELQTVKIVRYDPIGNYVLDNSSASSYGTNYFPNTAMRNILNNVYYTKGSGNCPNGSNGATVSCDFADKGLSETARNMTFAAPVFLGAKNSYPLVGGETFYVSERNNDVYNSLPSYQKEERVTLLYMSDYGYTFYKGVNDSCVTNLSSCSGASDSWMNRGNTIMPVSAITDQYMTFYISGTGSIGSAPASIARGDIHPVVHLNPELLYVSGNGSYESPYIIGV